MLWSRVFNFYSMCLQHFVCVGYVLRVGVGRSFGFPRSVRTPRFDLVRLGLSVQFGFRLILLGPTQHYPRLEVHKARARQGFDLAAVKFWPKIKFPSQLLTKPYVIFSPKSNQVVPLPSYFISDKKSLFLRQEIFTLIMLGSLMPTLFLHSLQGQEIFVSLVFSR